MRIESSQVDLASSHLLQLHYRRREQLKLAAQELPARPEPQRPEPEHHDQGRHRGLSDPTLHRRMALVRFLEALLAFIRGEGEKPRLKDYLGSEEGEPPAAPVPPTGSDPSPPPPAEEEVRFRISYTLRESYRETEVSRFVAGGAVSTADGREIQFSLTDLLARDFRAERALALKGRGSLEALEWPDPTGMLPQAQMAGTAPPAAAGETLSALALDGSILGVDANHDGAINGPEEVVNDFQELAALDDDGNGWIDEGDAAFADLRLVEGGAGAPASSAPLAERGVGALYLESVSTPFTFTDALDRPQALLRRSGIYLAESGAAGVLRQVDFVA